MLLAPTGQRAEQQVCLLFLHLLDSDRPAVQGNRGRAHELQHLLSVAASAHTDARITPRSRPWHGDSRAGTNGNIRQGSAADLQRSVPRTRSISAIGHGAPLVAASG